MLTSHNKTYGCSSQQDIQWYTYIDRKSHKQQRLIIIRPALLIMTGLLRISVLHFTTNEKHDVCILKVMPLRELLIMQSHSSHQVQYESSNVEPHWHGPCSWWGAIQGGVVILSQGLCHLPLAPLVNSPSVTGRTCPGHDFLASASPWDMFEF